MKKAACVGKDPEIFFPERGDAQSGNEAKVICFSCPVRMECRDYKKRTGSEYGIWGGEYSKRSQSSDA